MHVSLIEIYNEGIRDLLEPTGEDGQELIRLQPLNAKFAPKVVEREAVAGMYKAVFVVRAVG